MQICNKNACTGCGACYNACPKKCIKMVEEKDGTVLPHIDTEKCIKCNICKTTCPVNNKIELKEPMKVYAAWSLNEETRRTSSSGGIAFEIYKYIIEHGGIAVGTKFNKEMKLKYQIATTIKEAKEFKGSKYVQSSTGDIFKEIKEKLLENKVVVFIGTPCQVSGLKNYLKNVDTKNLFLIDLICHGVPPQKYLEEYFKYLKINNKIDNISFRGENNWNFTAYKDNNIVYKKHNKEDLYYKGFLNGVFYRENCYQCEYARKERVADITLGDFWGLGETYKFDYPTKDGVSVVLVNSDKGKELLENIKSQIFLEERTLKEAMLGNTQLNHPSIKRDETDEFKRKYIELGFNIAIESVMKEK